MNRTILFRGKQVTWVYGGFNKTSDGKCYILTDHESFEVDPKSVGQYSGSKDKNGKLIFEGDIVDCCRYKENEVHTVEIKDIRQLPNELFGSNVNWIEVKGNIYDKKIQYK